MANQDNGNSFKLNIGGPSIILLLTVLGLSVFAILAIRASYNGLKLARTSETSVSNYYKAEARAEEILHEVREIIASDAEAADELLLIPEVTEAAENRVVYEVPVNEATYLHVELGRGPDGTVKVTGHRLMVRHSDDYSGFGLDVELFDINF